jgi:hypothetical protein
VTETGDIVLDDVTGLDVLIKRLQGEFAYNNGLKGYQWDVSSGGANPNATNVGTGAYWDVVASDNKNTAGVVLKCR